MLSQSAVFFSLIDSTETQLPNQPTMSSQAGWNSVTGIATKLLDGSPLAIFIAIIITFGVPVFLHVVFYRAAASPPSCNFLLLGPSGAGKTAFTTLVCCLCKPSGPLGFLICVL